MTSPGTPALARLSQQSTNRSSSSLITASVTQLSSDEHSGASRPVDQHLIDLLHSEVIQLLISSEQAARQRRADNERLVEQQYGLSSSTSSSKPNSSGPAVVTKANDDAVRLRLESMGFKVGWAIAERLSRDRSKFPSVAPTAPPSTTTPSAPAPTASSTPPQPDPLEVVKFICKDVWTAMYDKQIDNLRTNHRGVYVLVDNANKGLVRISGVTGGGGGAEEEQMTRLARFFLAFPSGVIRGALAALGVSCTVSAESPALPQCTFQIKTIRPGTV
ncbi:transport protein particle component [Meredithblackwellia eburnea MCA 4105]